MGINQSGVDKHRGPGRYYLEDAGGVGVGGGTIHRIGGVAIQGAVRGVMVAPTSCNVTGYHVQGIYTCRKPGGQQLESKLQLSHIYHELTVVHLSTAHHE